MSTRRRFTEEFKLEAVKQVVDRGFGVQDVASRLGTSPHSLYAWINKYGIPAEQRLAQDDDSNWPFSAPQSYSKPLFERLKYTVKKSVVNHKDPLFE